MAILIKNADYLVKDHQCLLEHYDLFIEGNKIAKIGKNLEPGVDLPRENVEVINASGKVVMPGFVNAHTHLYQSFLKGVRDDLGLKEWCEKVTFPFAHIVHQDHWHKNDIEIGYYWSMVASIEMIKSGITCFVDMDLTLDSVFRAWNDIGIRGIGAITAVNRWVPEKLRRPDAERKKEIVQYIERWHQQSREGLTRIFLAPSTPFACTPDFLKWIFLTAVDYDLGIQTHISETRWEVEQMVSETGYYPLDYLESLGLLTIPISAVHCVHLTDNELDLAKARGVTVVYNPKSNMKLGSGVAPVVKMLEKDLPVALANDGPASNDLMDMFEEMRAAALLQKAVHEDPSVISASDVFQMATSRGAMVAGIEAGTLEEGKLADVIIVNLQKTHIMPFHNLLQSLVYCGKSTDVETTIINGQLIMKDREILTVNENKIFSRAVDIAREKLLRLEPDNFSAEF